ncbi:hypothetical protein SFC57_11390 [Niallia circulans]|jgi:hypothetical protein|uniref:hypothetical protein n=1 Tax=Niallia circulans TaxID=1397 RepID=UPI003981A43B
MLKIKWVYSMLFLILFMSGCSNNEELKIVVEKLADNGEYKQTEIADQNQVLKIKDLLNEYDWKNEKIEHNRKADYIFNFSYTNPTVEEKPITYYVWLIDNDTIQISREKTEYVFLNKNESQELLEVLIKN